MMYLCIGRDVKKCAKSICQELNEHFLCPMLSDAVQIKEELGNITLKCEDGAIFCLPSNDCSKLPIYHSSAEEMAHYLWCKLVRTLGVGQLTSRGVVSMEMGVSEAPNQTAYFRCAVPVDEAALVVIESSTKLKRPTGGCPACSH